MFVLLDSCVFVTISSWFLFFFCPKYLWWNSSRLTSSSCVESPGEIPGFKCFLKEAAGFKLICSSFTAISLITRLMERFQQDSQLPLVWWYVCIEVQLDDRLVQNNRENGFSYKVIWWNNFKVNFSHKGSVCVGVCVDIFFWSALCAFQGLGFLLDDLIFFWMCVGAKCVWAPAVTKDSLNEHVFYKGRYFL